MCAIAVYRQSHSPRQLAWFECWQQPGTEYINIDITIRSHHSTTYVDAACCY